MLIMILDSDVEIPDCITIENVAVTQSELSTLELTQSQLNNVQIIIC